MLEPIFGWEDIFKSRPKLGAYFAAMQADEAGARVRARARALAVTRRLPEARACDSQMNWCCGQAEEACARGGLRLEPRVPVLRPWRYAGPRLAALRMRRRSREWQRAQQAGRTGASYRRRARRSSRRWMTRCRAGTRAAASRIRASSSRRAHPLVHLPHGALGAGRRRAGP